MSPRHTRPPPPLCIRRALHSTSKNDGGVHQEADLIRAATQNRSILEWSPLKCVASLFFLPSKRDERTLCFSAPVSETFQFRFIEVAAIPVHDRRAAAGPRQTI